MVLEAADGISLALPFPGMDSGVPDGGCTRGFFSPQVEQIYRRVSRTAPQLEQSVGRDGGGKWEDEMKDRTSGGMSSEIRPWLSIGSDEER